MLLKRQYLFYPGIALLTLAAVQPAAGQTDTLSTDADITLTGEIAGDQFGRWVALLDDVDMDGFADIAVGSRGNALSGLNQGRVQVFSGQTQALLYTLDGESPSDNFSEELADAGDVDNDGCSDLIVGAWASSAGGTAAGRAYVYSGRTGTLLKMFTGEAANDNLGDTVGAAGDVNNDGWDDVLIGAPTHDGVALRTGIVYVYSGKDWSLIRTHEGANENDRVGISATSAGDINGDGCDDIIVGSHLFDLIGPGDDRGRVWVYSGKDGSVLHTFTGESSGDNFGWSAENAGDVNNDGVPDIIVGALLNDVAGSNAGRAYVYSGANGALLYTFTGEGPIERFGISVSTAGDANHDGHDDVLIGAWFAVADGDPGQNFGRAYIYSGADGQLLQTFTGAEIDEHLGRPISGGKDVNNDGSPDVAAGARDNDTGGVDTGQAYVFFLAPPPCLGDLNGDGNVGSADSAIMLGSWNNPGGSADLNGDGFVGSADFALLLGAWGACP